MRAAVERASGHGGWERFRRGPCGGVVCDLSAYASDAVFYVCELSKVDQHFTKYPRLPVLSCSEYEEDEKSVWCCLHAIRVVAMYLSPQRGKIKVLRLTTLPGGDHALLHLRRRIGATRDEDAEGIARHVDQSINV
jgi:hypothetical protein